MPDIRLTTLKCRIKPKGPEDCGYLSWNTVKAELAKQAQRPLAERLRPCVPQKVWLYCSTCMKCRNALWGVLVDGAPVQAEVRRMKGPMVELYLPDREEMLTYSLTRGEWKCPQRETQA